MLGGIDPILIFQFSKLTPSELTSISKIPIVSTIVNKIGLPPIPIYLSESLTGLHVESEEKSIEVETRPETLSNGDDPSVNQKGLASIVRVNLICNKNSIGLTLLSAVADLIFPKVTSREYSLSYLHGATTVFGGLLHSYNVTAAADSELMMIRMEISKSTNKTVEKKANPSVTPKADAATLREGAVQGAPPTGILPNTPIKGPLPSSGPAGAPPVIIGPG